MELAALMEVTELQVQAGVQDRMVPVVHLVALAVAEHPVQMGRMEHQVHRVALVLLVRRVSKVHRV